MGQMARIAFPKKIHATVFSGTKRPRSCMADGVQMASCCMIGKNNITVVEENEARAIFTDREGAFEVSVLPDLVKCVDTHMNHETEEDLSVKIYSKHDKDLFKVRQVTASNKGS